jgi:hypothetical protein
LQSLRPWSSAADFIKSNIPFYNQGKFRGWESGISVFGAAQDIISKGDPVLLGNYLDKVTRKQLEIKDFDAFKAEVSPFIDKLAKDNPTLARMYVGALLGQSTDEVSMNNMMSAIEPVAGSRHECGRICLGQSVKYS